MSKAFLNNLVAHNTAVPVKLAQLRGRILITRLPALALWLLAVGNSVFVLLIIVLAGFAI
jgi:hypothetical protein